MPEPNARIAVTGRKRVHDSYERLEKDRKELTDVLQELGVEASKADRRLARLRRRVRRGN